MNRVLSICRPDPYFAPGLHEFQPRKQTKNIKSECNVLKALKSILLSKGWRLTDCDSGIRLLLKYCKRARLRRTSVRVMNMVNTTQATNAMAKKARVKTLVGCKCTD